LSLTGIRNIFALLFHLRDGVISGGEPGLGLALLVHHELGEVPFDGVHQEASLLGLKCVMFNWFLSIQSAHLLHVSKLIDVCHFLNKENLDTLR